MSVLERPRRGHGVLRPAEQPAVAARDAGDLAERAGRARRARRRGRRGSAQHVELVRRHERAEHVGVLLQRGTASRKTSRGAPTGRSTPVDLDVAAAGRARRASAGRSRMIDDEPVVTPTNTKRRLMPPGTARRRPSARPSGPPATSADGHSSPPAPTASAPASSHGRTSRRPDAAGRHHLHVRGTARAARRCTTGPTTDAGNSLTASAPARQRGGDLARGERARERQAAAGDHRLEQRAVEVRGDEELGAGVERRVELRGGRGSCPRPTTTSSAAARAPARSASRGARRGERELDRAHARRRHERVAARTAGVGVGRAQHGDHARGAQPFEGHGHALTVTGWRGGAAVEHGQQVVHRQAAHRGARLGGVRRRRAR